MNISLHRGYLPGCIGRIAELHARYYHEQVGFGVQFESKVARELAEFCARYAERRDGLWLALINDVVHGSIVIDGAHGDQAGAHLRWFITSDRARGKGIGNTLLNAAMEFCSSLGYTRIYLWTFEGLTAAKHLYEKAGFKLIHQQTGTQWGSPVNEQRFERLMVTPMDKG